MINVETHATCCTLSDGKHNNNNKKTGYEYEEKGYEPGEIVISV